MPNIDDITITTLPSGLRIATVPMHSVETVTVGIWIHAGSRLESAADCGVAHFLEHMSFKGTARRTAHQIAEEVEMVGGHSNAYTAKENTAYHIKLLAKDLPLAVDILGDIVLNSTFVTDELERERGVILQEMAMYEDQPDEMAFDHFQARAYPDQPMGRTILGFKDVVSNMSAEQLRGYVARHYSADRSVIVAAGKIEHDDFVALIIEHFGDFAHFDTPTPEAARYTGGVISTPDDCEQMHLILGWPSCSYQDMDQHYASVALSGILGSGMSSRLFQEIREKRGLAYSVHAFHIPYQDDGLFGFYAATAPEKASEALGVSYDLLGQMRHNISDKELTKIKAQMKAGLLMSQESSSSRAETAAKQLLLHNRIILTSERIARIDALDISQLAAWVDTLLARTATLSLYGDVDQVTIPSVLTA
ncbi:MAG: insulinase family protein [Alphaproteobacteria bacterium]|nr:insulinase family protein [Alphaproteobacteria bacterium]